MNESIAHFPDLRQVWPALISEEMIPLVFWPVPQERDLNPGSRYSVRTQLYRLFQVGRREKEINDEIGT
jgi:hypothetical protein